MMKHRLLLWVLPFLACMTWAQEQNRVAWTPLDSTYEACLMARRSLQGKIASKEEMKEASRLFVKIFQRFNIPIIDRSYADAVDIEGHIVYLPSFFDGLTDGRKIYEFAKQYRESSERRGVENNRQVKVANNAVKKGGTLVMQYAPDGKTIDIALVTEPKRQVTMYVEAFDDKGCKLGERIQRRDSAYKGYSDCVLKNISVPHGTAYFKITVQNKSKKDSSFVLIISD